jgi:hypothetical protein
MKKSLITILIMFFIGLFADVAAQTVRPDRAYVYTKSDTLTNTGTKTFTVASALEGSGPFILILNGTAVSGKQYFKAYLEANDGNTTFWAPVDTLVLGATGNVATTLEKNHAYARKYRCRVVGDSTQVTVVNASFVFKAP